MSEYIIGSWIHGESPYECEPRMSFNLNIPVKIEADHTIPHITQSMVVLLIIA